MNKPVLLVGGAPKIHVDAVRFVTVDATGQTAVQLQHLLKSQFELDSIDLLLSHHAAMACAVPSLCYQDRSELEAQLQLYLSKCPDATVFMSAAVNDYQFAATSVRRGNDIERYEQADHKISSGADELCIYLKPATKLIDQLKDYGHRGALFACKYEEAETVVESAQHLCERVQAVCVLANSLCGSIQALVDRDDSKLYTDRSAVLIALAERIADSARI